MHHQYSLIICQLSDIKSHMEMISKNGANPSKFIGVRSSIQKIIYYAHTRNNSKIYFLKAIIDALQCTIACGEPINDVVFGN